MTGKPPENFADTSDGLDNANLEEKKEYEQLNLQESVYKELCEAVENRNQVLVKKLIMNHNIVPEVKKAVFFYFVQESDIEAVKYLISQGIDVNITNDSRVTALHIACENNNLEMVRYLLEKGIKIDIPTIIDLLPLQVAATRIASEDGNQEIIKELLTKYIENKLDINDNILLDVDNRLRHGPDYIRTDFRNYVQEILGKDAEWTGSDLIDANW